MELSSQDQPGDIPIPMNTTTTYGHHHGHGHGHGHMHHHLHHVSQNPNIIPSNSPSQHQPQPSNGGTSIPMHISLSTQTLEEDHSQDHDHDVPYNNNNSKKSSMVVVKYKECLKNHAAAMGGNATDGCGEFMPSGVEGTIEALTCSACNCHRNFHRKEIQGSENSSSPHRHHYNRNSRSKVNILGHHQYYPKNVLAPAPESLGYPTPTGTLIASRAMPQHHHHHMIMSYHSMGSSDHDQSDEDHGHGHHGHHHQVLKKRFRTKFTQEQKEKMLNFAEKVGWKIQKQEDSVVQQFCQEIGVKRRVLKVWMHNNKHNLAKKNNNNNLPDLQPPSTTTNTTTTSS